MKILHLTLTCVLNTGAQIGEAGFIERVVATTAEAGSRPAAVALTKIDLPSFPILS